MDVPVLLSKAQMRRIEPFFPLSHGVIARSSQGRRPADRVGDHRCHQARVDVARCAKDYGPHKTIYNRFIRRSRLGVSNRISIAATVCYWL